jgi:deoxyribose-phosphate aldolase
MTTQDFITAPVPVASARELARVIDHTFLKPDATDAEIRKLCAEARDHGFYSVCVNPVHLALCSAELAGTGVKAVTVVGFPLGANTTETKIFETSQAVGLGADEIDMVINVGALKAGDREFVKRDIRGVVQAAHRLPVKVILETCLLTDEEKKLACLLSKQAGARYVKTSTGFSKGGATAEDIELMRAAVGETVGVKASGGIRTFEQALDMVRAGASRIGASASVAIVTAAKEHFL